MSYSSEVLADTPRGWYRCWDASGNIQDSSGNGLHAVSTHGGSSFTYDQPGPLSSDASSKSILFNASSFSATHNALLNLADIFTLEAWVKRSSLVAAGGIISKQGNTYFMRLIDATDVIELLKSGAASIVSSTQTITDTTNWYHCVCTKNGATVKQYINGSDVTGTVSNATCVDTANNLFIGSDTAGADFFTGYLSEVAVYSTALSQARVQAHYTAGIATSVIPPISIPTQVARW